jgi:hypothetical protein
MAARDNERVNRGPPNGLDRFSARMWSVSLAAAAACAICGCGTNYASSDPAFPGDFE